MRVPIQHIPGGKWINGECNVGEKETVKEEREMKGKERIS
jgi:hypothetical protein